MKTLKERFEENIFYSPDGCWYWTGATGTGSLENRGRISVNGVNCIAYRVSYELYVSLIPTGLLVCHRCDNGLCVNPNHLFVGTSKDNMDDMYRKGRGNKSRGDSHPNSKLTDIDVNRMRSLKLMGISDRLISKSMCLNYETVRGITGNRSWKHLPTPSKM